MNNNSPSSEPEIGVLLVNLGTPTSPTRRDIRRFLREFLSDTKVMTMAPALRWTLVNLLILPFRPKKLVPAYEQIWLDEGSPLLVYSRALQEAMSQRLGDGFFVELAMRYQTPDIRSALQRMKDRGIRKLILLPQFPQYSEASTGSVLLKVEQELAELGNPFELRTLRDFHDETGFIEAQAATARAELDRTEWDHVLFSFHGLPESQIREVSGCLTEDRCCHVKRDEHQNCYRAQCFATSKALADALELPSGQYSTSFQSRLTRDPWIKPYTDIVLPELYERGIRRLFVMCPAFTADNLETAEEIDIRLREQWRELGGDEFALAPCVNDSAPYAQALTQWVHRLSGE